MKRSLDAIVHADQARYLEGLEPPATRSCPRWRRTPPARDLPISDPEVASFLAVTARACAPRLVVELGTNIGYGAIVLARAAGPAARVLTIERSTAHVRGRTRVHRARGASGTHRGAEGQALAVLARAHPSPSIDFAYVDCVKEEYEAYLGLLVPRLSGRGVIVADNVLWRGHVARAEVPESERVRAGALRRFNEAIVKHPELRAVVLPLGDGVAYAVKV